MTIFGADPTFDTFGLDPGHPARPSLMHTADPFDVLDISYDIPGTDPLDLDGGDVTIIGGCASTRMPWEVLL
jgi:hypothetical protein